MEAEPKIEKEYFIIACDSKKELERIINDYRKIIGFEFVGGSSLTYGGYGFTYTQAILIPIAREKK